MRPEGYGIETVEETDSGFRLELNELGYGYPRRYGIYLNGIRVCETDSREKALGRYRSAVEMVRRCDVDIRALLQSAF